MTGRDAAPSKPMGVMALRKIAHDMPYKNESSREEIIRWLQQYAPDRLPDVTPPARK